jgi:hypothetical protein
MSPRRRIARIRATLRACPGGAPVQTGQGSCQYLRHLRSAWFDSLDECPARAIPTGYTSNTHHRSIDCMLEPSLSMLIVSASPRYTHNVCLTLEQPKTIRRWQRSLRISDRIASRNAKNRQACHAPLNEEAENTLHRWREQSGPGAHLFDVATGFRNGKSCSSAPGPAISVGMTDPLFGHYGVDPKPELQGQNAQRSIELIAQPWMAARAWPWARAPPGELTHWCQKIRLLNSRAACIGTARDDLTEVIDPAGSVQCHVGLQRIALANLVIEVDRHAVPP